jgi:hypothetical protein
LAGFGGFAAAPGLDVRTTDVSQLGLAVVAGWLAGVIAVAEVVRTRQGQAAERAQSAEDARQRRRSRRCAVFVDRHWP